MQEWDFPGGPVVKTLSSQCQGHKFKPPPPPRVENKDPVCGTVEAKKKKSGAVQEANVTIQNLGRNGLSKAMLQYNLDGLLEGILLSGKWKL